MSDAGVNGKQAGPAVVGARWQRRGAGESEGVGQRGAGC
jgi:hypothetical protein